MRADLIETIVRHPTRCWLGGAAGLDSGPAVKAASIVNAGRQMVDGTDPARQLTGEDVVLGCAGTPTRAAD